MSRIVRSYADFIFQMGVIMNKKKVLIVVDTMFVGGIEKAALRFQCGMDKDKFDFTYLVRLWPNGPLEREAISNGATVIHFPSSERGLTDEIKYYKKLFNKEKYDIVHCHSTFYNGIILWVAYKCGINKRISHAHMTRDISKSLIKRGKDRLYSFVMQRFLCRYATDLLACSTVAGEALYGKRNFRKRGIMINNPVEVNKYYFDEAVRKLVRDKMKILDSTLVWGHVGRLNKIKNHMFLIDLFARWRNSHTNSVLILVGDDPEKTKLKEKVNSLGLNDYVFFMGNRDDVNILLMAMDIFVFPSMHEGFPISLIEAQIVKLPCLVSDTVTYEAKLNDNVSYASLNAPYEEWIEKIEHLLTYDRNSIDISKIKSRFGINSVGCVLEEIYLKNLE